MLDDLRLAFFGKYLFQHTDLLDDQQRMMSKKESLPNNSQPSNYRSANSIQPLSSGVKHVPARRLKKSKCSIPSAAKHTKLNALKEITTSSKNDDNIRKRVFSMLHRPTRFEYLYHFLVVTLVTFSCCTLNLLKPKNEWDDAFLFVNYHSIHLTMCATDSFVFGKSAKWHLQFKWFTTSMFSFMLSSFTLWRNSASIMVCWSSPSILFSAGQMELFYWLPVPKTAWPCGPCNIIWLSHI